MLVIPQGRVRGLPTASRRQLGDATVQSRNSPIQNYTRQTLQYQESNERDVSARWGFWRRNKQDTAHIAQDTTADTSQLDGVDMDEHAADMVINMLEEKMLQGVPGQAHPRAMQPRQLPPEQPPPMPELSSAATVLEGQRQSIESINDQVAPEPPRIPPSQPEEVAQAVSSQRGVLDPPPSDQPWEQTAAQWEDTAPTYTVVQERTVHVPAGQPELVPAATPFSTACAVAMCILGAARLGQNEEHIEARGDTRAQQLLRKRQQENFAANQALPGEEETSEQRIQAARLKAAQQAQEEAARQKEYAAVAAEEAARDKLLREKAKKEYEEAEARRAEELERRVELERIMLKKRREEMRAAEEAAQVARDEAERQAAAERAEQLERERRQAAEAAAAAEKERVALNKERQMLVARAEGTAVIGKAGLGLTTSGRVKVPATIEVSAEATNVLSGEAGPVVAGAAHLEDAKDISITVAGEVASLLCKQQMSALVAQKAIGRGPLMKMNQVELQHWMNELSMAVQAAATSRLRDACTQFSAVGETGTQMQKFSIKVERGMLRQSHKKRSHALFEDSLVDVQQSNATAEQNVHACLSLLSAEERPWVEGSLVAAGVTKNVNCRHITDVCVAAHLVDFSETMWPDDAAEAPEWHHQLISMAQNWLSKQLVDAEPDSLLDIAEMACWAMDDEHPITIHMLESAEKNLSLKKKMAVVERQRALDDLMAQLQDEEILSSSEISAQLAWEKQDLIPVPERVWALRNTGSTMALGDKRSRAKARDIFEMALELQRQHQSDDPGHPGLLGELWRLSELLQKDEDSERTEESVSLDEEALQILVAVVERYRAEGDMLSASVLASAAIEAYASLANSSHCSPATQKSVEMLGETAESMFDGLAPAEQNMVREMRGSVDAIESLILMFTEELGVYSIRTGNKANKMWAEGKLLPLVQSPIVAV